MERQPNFVRTLISNTISNSLRRSNRNLAQSPILAVGMAEAPAAPRRRRNLLRVRPIRRNRQRANSEPTNSNDGGMSISVNERPHVNLMDLFGANMTNGADALWERYENIYFNPSEYYNGLKREEDKILNEQLKKRPSKRRKRSTRKDKEPVYEDCNECAINGTEECDGQHMVTLNCGCKTICKSCAISWLKQSSTCPFCRKNITSYTEEGKRTRQVAEVVQRGDHDLSINFYRLSYFNANNVKITHDIILQQSYIFANTRSTHVSKEVLIYLQMISSSQQNRFVMPADCIIAFMDLLFNKISKIGIYQQLLFRVSVYYALYSPSDYMMAKASTLLSMLVAKVKEKRLKSKKKSLKTWDVNLFNEKKLTISQEVFRSPPLRKLFSTSIANLILHAHPRNLYRTIVIDKIIDVEPSLVYIMAAADDFMNPQLVDLT